AVIGRTDNTGPGWGYGGYFSGGFFGVYARTFTTAGTSPYSTTAIRGDALEVTSFSNYGVFGLAQNGATNYGVYCSGNGGYTGTWTLVSDQRFKKDVKTIDNSALGLIQKLNPVSYHLKTDEYKIMNFPTGTQYGFVAQELEKVFPILVENGTHPGENKTDPELKFKAVNYIGLIPVLTKAMQEQQSQIEKQAKENEALKKKNEELEKDIKAIKAKLGIQ
ncbi:MAG: tail fiber domain-containing protein, partial [Ferruginibacter sp.]